MAHRGPHTRGNTSSDPARYRGIPIAVEPARTVHCKAVNQQIDPAVARSRHHDPQSAACFGCGDSATDFRCKPRKPSAEVKPTGWVWAEQLRGNR